jgi:hypothetical protein
MFITRAIERGVDVKTIAEWQGHKDGGKLILDTYSHVNRVHSRPMAQLINDESANNVIPLTLRHPASGSIEICLRPIRISSVFGLKTIAGKVTERV